MTEQTIRDVAKVFGFEDFDAVDNREGQPVDLDSAVGAIVAPGATNVVVLLMDGTPATIRRLPQY